MPFAFPMVSFCDLRLSELKENIGTYGKFGIGMTKSWAVEKGLNQVFYVNKESPFSDNLLKGYLQLLNRVRHYEDPSGELKGGYDNIWNAIRYLKNYEGDLIRPGRKTIKNFTFANEREWRYVPPVNAEIRPYIPIKEIETPAQKARHNQKAKHLRLSFQPHDIKYLIVESEDNIVELIEHLRDVKEKFPLETRDKLASRILTYDQIENDI